MGSQNRTTDGYADIFCHHVRANQAHVLLLGKLVGHTDNIRAILISEDSKYVRMPVKIWSPNLANIPPSF